jgi:hypothetical protein
LVGVRVLDECYLGNLFKRLQENLVCVGRKCGVGESHKCFFVCLGAEEACVKTKKGMEWNVSYMDFKGGYVCGGAINKGRGFK